QVEAVSCAFSERTTLWWNASEVSTFDCVWTVASLWVTFEISCRYAWHPWQVWMCARSSRCSLAFSASTASKASSFRLFEQGFIKFQLSFRHWLTEGHSLCGVCPRRGTGAT